MHAPPARNASWSTVNASGDASEQVQRATHVRLGARRETADADTLRLERGIELVVHDPPVAQHDECGMLADLGRERATTRSRFDPWRTEIFGRDRPVPVEIERVDAAVAPDLLGCRGPLHVGEPLGGFEAPLHEPVWARDRPCGVGSERGGHGIARRVAGTAVSRLRPPCSAR